MLESLYCLLLSLILSSCEPMELRTKEYQLSTDTPDPTRAPDEFYVIGPGDVIGIVVWKDATLSGSVKVRPDGFITLPLINEVQVTGLTTGEVRNILEEKYKQFLISPFVTIRVETISSSEIFLIGEVTKPGAYPITGKDTLFQLLTRAGGLNTFASRSDIRVVRREKDRVTEYIVDYDGILKGDLKQDILLRPGDRIIVR